MRGIRDYDKHTIHSMGLYQFAFNNREFKKIGGRIEVWKGDSCIGTIKHCFPVGIALEDLPLDLNGNYQPLHKNKWLFQIDEGLLESQTSDAFQREQYFDALYEAAFQAAQLVGAAGVVSEWDEPAAKAIWTRLAQKYGATVEDRLIEVGRETENPKSLPVYIALFKENERAAEAD